MSSYELLVQLPIWAAGGGNRGYVKKRYVQVFKFLWTNMSPIHTPSRPPVSGMCVLGCGCVRVCVSVRV